MPSLVGIGSSSSEQEKRITAMLIKRSFVIFIYDLFKLTFRPTNGIASRKNNMFGLSEKIPAQKLLKFEHVSLPVQIFLNSGM
jgi:hypothetical protein